MSPRPGSASPIWAGRAGLALTALSVAATFTVAVTGTSVMEPPFPGRAGQPPWAFDAHLSPYLVIALAAVGLLAGTAGLALTLFATRRGWPLPVRALLLGGLLAALALTLVPPFGSSDPLSYAAYGRILVTGHNPYVMAPDVLARLGDPVARAVQDWKTTPSDYGVVATAGQALASLVGGTSARLTVFVLSVLNLAAFAGTGLILHRLARGDRARQARAVLLWTANPLLLQVLVAGQHVDNQAIFFGVAAVAVFAQVAGRPLRSAFGYAAAAGALAGLGFAVKITVALVGGGLALAALRSYRGHGRRLLAVEGGLAAGFAVVAGIALGVGGGAGFHQTVQASSMVSIGSPWRVIRTVLHLALHESTADDIVKAAAALLAVLLAVLLWRGLPFMRKGLPARAESAAAGVLADRARLVELAGRGALALSLAWLLAWPYVLPWYDGLAWALLPLIAVSDLDWLLLARTTALAIGYLPARAAGVVIPPGLGWLQSVVRTGVTPAILAIVVVWLIVDLRRGSSGTSGPFGTGGAYGTSGTPETVEEAGAPETGGAAAAGASPASPTPSASPTPRAPEVPPDSAATRGEGAAEPAADGRRG